MRQIKVGIIGAGAISHTHCQGINAHPQGVVAAVADVNLHRREEFAKKYDLSRTYASGDALIADADLDAVTIAVPNVFHAPLAIQALQAGKHVLLEKPFAMNLPEALRVAQAAKRSGKVLMVGMNQRFGREAQIIKAIIDRGQLGEIYHGKAAWMRRAGIPRLYTWFERKDMSGGGALLDIGVHVLDLCLHLMGNFAVEAVSGATYSKFGPRGLGEGGWGQSDPGEKRFDVDDFTTAFIKLKGGASVCLDASWAIHQEPNGLHFARIFGTEAGASVFPSPRIFQRQGRQGDYAVIEPHDVAIAYPACCRFANWLDAILDQAAPMCTISESLAVQRTLDAIYESAASGKEVRLGTTDFAGVKPARRRRNRN